MARTQAEETSQDDGTEQEEEADGELGVLANSRREWLACRGLPECVKWL